MPQYNDAMDYSCVKQILRCCKDDFNGETPKSCCMCACLCGQIQRTENVNVLGP